MMRSGLRQAHTLLTAVFSLIGVAMFATDPAPLVIERADTAPVIDGSGEDPAWQQVPWHGDFRVLGQAETAAAVQTRFKLVHDGFRLFALVEATEPETAKLRLVSRNIRDDVLWNDDCVQLHLDPGGRGLGYFQFIVNWKGTAFDALAEDDNRGIGTFAVRFEWNTDVQAAARVDEDCWRAEFSVPLAAFGLHAGTSPRWGINVCRSRYAGGAAEHSTYAALPPDKGFGQPSHYVRTVLADFDPSPFLWRLSAPATRVVKRNGELVCEVRTTIQNQTGEFRIMNVTAELGEARVVRELDLKHLQEGTITLDIPFTEPGEYRLRLTLARRAMPDVVLAQTETPLVLDYQPLRVTLIEPAYRDCIFASQNLETVVVRVATEPEYADKPLTVTLAGEGFTPVTHRFAHAKPTRTVEFAATDLPEGRYTLSAAVTGAPPVIRELRKLPHVPGEVWLDARGNTFVDGKPFLPFGWFSAPADKEPDMTALQTYGLWSDVAAIRRTLDRALEGGKKLLLSPFQGEKAYSDPIKDEARRGAFTHEHAERVRTVVNAIKDHPAILGWYMADEPEGRGHSVEWYKAAYALLREIDPHHPCIMLNYGLRGIRTYYEGCDILMPDCYPVFRVDGTTRKPLWALTEWTETARALRPTWLVPQVFDWDGTGTITSPGRAPTFDEVRNQVWQAFAAGGRGILMYSYMHDSRTSCDLRLGPAYMAREARALKPMLFGTAVGEIEVHTTPTDTHFAATLLRSGDDLLLIAVNTSYEPRAARFRLDGPVPDNVLHVVGEKRTVTLDDRAFVDDFAPIATHLYTTSASVAERSDVAEIRRNIAAAETARLQPGNVVGLGGLPRHRLQQIADSAPEGRPVITYSSWQMQYSNHKRQWHILYLLDGLTRDVLHHSWVPRGNDKTPWLEVALPEPGLVGRVSLYTPTANGEAKLRGFRVSVRLPDGTLEPVAEIAGNEAHRIDIPFPAKIANAVRIEVTDFSTRLEGCSESGLITEVEVYAE